jgi:hypothetical protein
VVLQLFEIALQLPNLYAEEARYRLFEWKTLQTRALVCGNQAPQQPRAGAQGRVLQKGRIQGWNGSPALRSIMGDCSGRRRRVALCCSMDATEKMRTGYCSVPVIWAVARLRPHRLRSWRVEAETRFSQSRVLTSEKLRKQIAFTPRLGGAANGTLWLFCPVVALIQLLSR